MANIDNVAEASAFVGFEVGQLISKKVLKAYTIWVYENAVIKTMGKQTFFWTPEGGQEYFAISNRLPIAESYVPSAKMELAKEYAAEVSAVYKGFKSAADDKARGITRVTPRLRTLSAAIGRNLIIA